MKKHILIIDDDAHIREVIRFALEKSGMAVHQAGDGRAALDYLASNHADLIILDITMPELDGLEVCRELRKTSEIPILFLSSRDDEIDRVIGLEIGGDDYVTKPFSPRELVARVNAILKRVNKISPAITTQKILGKLHVKLDLESHSAYWNDQPVALTVTEFMLLQTFLKTPGKTFTRDDLMTVPMNATS